VEADKPGGAMESLSLRFVDPVLEGTFQRHGGRAGHAAYLVTAGASAVLWPIAGWLLPQVTGLAFELAWPIALTMSALSIACVLAGSWAMTLDRQHGLLVVLTSANGLVILGLAALTDFLPGYGVSAIMLLFAYGFVSRTRFIFAAVRTAIITAGFIYLVGTYAGTANLAIDIFIYAAMSVGTLIALRLLERDRRQVFHQQLVIAEQATEIEREKDKSDRLLLNVLPASIMARLREGETTIAEDYPSVTVLFSDIVGFTPLAARHPAASIIRLLDDLFAAFDEAAEQRGLEKIKTIGDAYMAAGGLTDPDSDHPLRVVDLGLSMLDEAERRAADWPGLALRIGVHTGPASGGVIGRRKFAFDLWGDTINVASRLEQHGVRGRVHISAQTWERVRHEFACDLRGETELRGLGGQQTYLVVGRAAVHHSLPPAAHAEAASGHKLEG
jgi:class 3 adenylate cyclase